MLAIATLISAVASLVMAGVAVYNGVKEKKTTAEKITVVAESIPGMTEKLAAIDAARKQVKK